MNLEPVLEKLQQISNTEKYVEQFKRFYERYKRDGFTAYYSMVNSFGRVVACDSSEMRTLFFPDEMIEEILKDVFGKFESRREGLMDELFGLMEEAKAVGELETKGKKTATKAS